MKRLTLVRHAKSSWDDVHTSDLQRPLNKRGNSDAPKMGRHLEREFFQSGRVPRPDRLVSSPAVRALTTARIIAGEIGVPPESIQVERRIYEASAQALLHLIREFQEPFCHVMLFGHNPGFEILAQALDPSFQGDDGKYPTCGVALFELEAATWPQVAEAGATRSVFLYPKMLED